MQNASSTNDTPRKSALSNVPLFDLYLEHQTITDELTSAFQRVLRNSAFILGAEVSNFERHVVDYLGGGHAVGLSNGSDALFVALRTLGIGPGCEVITSPFTFVATAEAIVRCGATPVFADIEPDSFGLCPASTARMLSPKTRAVLAVHLYGHPGNVLELERFCAEHDLALLEDACQAFGAKAGGRPVGTIGTIGVYSFFPTKPLGGFGDGGLLVTQDDALAAQAKRLRSHGLGTKGDYELLGGNFRLDSLHAALLDVKLSRVDWAREERRAIASRYDRALAHSTHLRPPTPPDRSVESAWALYTIRVPRHRDALLRHLEAHHVEARIYYPKLLTDQPLFSSSSRADDLVHARVACREVVSIPIFAGLSFEVQQRVIEALGSFAPNT